MLVYIITTNSTHYDYVPFSYVIKCKHIHSIRWTNHSLFVYLTVLFHQRSMQLAFRSVTCIVCLWCKHMARFYTCTGLCIVQMIRLSSTLSNEKSTFGCAWCEISIAVVSCNCPTSVIYLYTR